MAKPEAEKDKGKGKEKAKAKGPPPGQEKAKPKKEKDKDKEKAPATAAADGKEKEKPKPAPRPPADPRLKVLKKFYGKFLPRGPLRDRHKALMQRWNSGEDHGGVTVDELKSLYDDWKAARARNSSAIAR